jgi:hypothetical protein
LKAGITVEVEAGKSVEGCHREKMKKKNNNNDRTKNIRWWNTGVKIMKVLIYSKSTSVGI